VTTRLYTPSDFSVLSVFVGLVSIISVAACLRFDIAVSLPKNDVEAINILALALGFAAVISVSLFFLVISIPDQIAHLLNQPEFEKVLWLVPVAVLLASTYSALQMWFVRSKMFSLISKTRIIQATAGASIQVSFGWFRWAPFGLLLGQTLNSGAGCLGLGYRLIIYDQVNLKNISWLRMRAAFISNVYFPKYSTFEALSNSAAIYFPIIMIAALAVGPEAGYLGLAMFVLQAPVGLIGTAVSQVYLSRAPSEHRAGNIGMFTAEVIGGLVKCGVGPLIFAGIVAPSLFVIIFGPEWSRAGVLVAWMTPWFVMQFLSSTVSMALHVTGSQRAAMLLQLFGLSFRVGVVYLVSLVNRNFISEAYALSGFVFYFVYFVVVLSKVSVRSGVVLGEMQKGLVAILLWIIVGISVALSVDGLLMLD